MKLNNSKYLICFVALIATLSSCNFIFIELYGIDHNIDFISDEEIKNQAKDLDIKTSELYKMDTSFYSYVNQIDSSLSLFRQNNYQPLQYKVFDKNGKLVSHLANCYAGGFPNLNWEWMFADFPPKANSQLFDSLLLFSELEAYLKPISSEPINQKTSDYNVVVIWTGAFGRQNRRFIKEVKAFRASRQENCSYYFVNFDNCFTAFSEE